MMNHRGTERTKSLLDLALEGKSDEFKRKVLEIVLKAGLPPDDPSLIFLVASGRLEVLLSEAPSDWHKLFKAFLAELERSRRQLVGELNSTSAKIEQAALARFQLRLSEIAAELVAVSKRELRQESFPYGRVYAVAITACCAFALFWAGIQFGKTQIEGDADVTIGRRIVNLNREQILKCMEQERRSCPVFLWERRSK